MNFNSIKEKNSLSKDSSIIKKSFAFTLILCFIHNCTYANSSWHWISTTRPYDVLPFVVVLTLAIETISILKFSNIENKLKTFIVVLIGNVLSFAAPYVFFAFLPGPIYTFYDWLERSPFYTIGEFYLFTTILMEFPIIYNVLKKHTINKRVLVITIICVNILTTLMTYTIERIFCKGLW